MNTVTSQNNDRHKIANLIARDMGEGWNVNLGIGIPTLVADLVPAEREVLFHSENGILGMGPIPDPDDVDPWLVNAGKDNVTLIPGASLFDHSISFSIIRGGHLDLCVLGAYQVSDKGDLANWTTSVNDTAPAVGGAMDLAVGAKRIWVAMEHTTKKGQSKIVKDCTLPLTAAGVVKRIYTNLAIFDLEPRGLVLNEIVADISFESLQSVTDATIKR